MEMNLHMPQDNESESELKNLAAVPYQIISPANNKAIIGIFQDSMLGCFRFTRENVRFTPREAMNLLMMFNRVNAQELLEKGDTITNFDILSQILPPLTMSYKTKLFKEGEDAKKSNHVLEIRNGKYIRGQMDKGVIETYTKGLLQRICNDFGNLASSHFVDDIQNIITEYMKSSAYSVGISDLISDNKTNQNIIQRITEKKNQVKTLIDQIQLGIFQNDTGKTNEQEFETQVNNILNQASAEAGKIGLESLDKNNRFVIMVNAGSKGSELNISQMISCLGQQNVDGKRIPYGFEQRTLPHFSKFDDSPGARGFVESSYINGLSPQELFFHAMGGRVGLIDTAVKTSSTGYIQRRLIKGLEDLMVGYDMTIRTNKNKIVQFVYGDDNIDTVKVENQPIPIVTMSTQEIYSHFNLPETVSSAKELSLIFEKNTLKRAKKQKEEINQKCKQYTDMMIDNREDIIKNVFKNKGDNIVSVPVAFSYIIGNIQGQQNINSNSMVDITLLEAYEMIENTFQNLEKIHYAKPTLLFKIMYYYYLSAKDLLINKRFNRSALTILLNTIAVDYKRAIVSPGEMVGMTAGQSMGEVSTQMSVAYYVRNKIVCVNKMTREISHKSVVIGEFCDALIRENPETTFNTGHANSVETLLEHLDTEYYVVGVSEDEKTAWNKISHVSRHPVNGQMMKVTTRSGRVVETTTSHSHLIRKDQRVVPIVGADMKEGMRIPVCRYIENRFVKDTVTIGDKNYKLDALFGWFVGAYLAEGNINGSSICITNIAHHYIESTKRFAALFGKECCVSNRKCEYGPSTTTKFTDKVLAKFIVDTCDNGSFVKKVPDFAFTAPNEFKAALFQGYFDGDGNFQNDDRHHQIRACSRSEQLVKDLALILNYFGIIANIKTETHKEKPLYHLNISPKYARIYDEQIGTVLHKEKLEDLIRYMERDDAKKVSEQIDRINGLGDIIAHCGKTLKIPGQSRDYGRCKKMESIGRSTLEKYIRIFESHPDAKLIHTEIQILKQATNSNVMWDEIVSIELYTPDQNNFVYDFTVPGNQTFMTDYGVIVHNTLNSFTFETPIIVRNRDGIVQKVQLGEFIEEKIKVATKKEYYENKDTTYAEVDDYYEIPSCDEDGNVLWKRVEAVTRHPVINEDGTNTMIKVTTDEEREVIATKAKSFLKLVHGKLVPYQGKDLKVGDFVPVSTKQIDFTETSELYLRTLLPPTKYVYGSEMEKAKAVMGETFWWKKHSGKTFVLPYKRSDSFVVKVSDKLRPGSKSKTILKSGCIYTLQTNMCDYEIPETIPLDYNFGYFVGAYAAEGCMTQFQMSISNNDSNYFQPIVELCKQWNVNTKVYRNENKNGESCTSQDIRIYNTVLCRIMETLCGKLSHHKFVSDKIVFSNRECMLGFLDAYIGGDGSVRVKDKCITMASVSKTLLTDVQQILNNLGVYGFITKPTKCEFNNCGSKDIKQLYTMFVRNKQAKKLANMLNTKISYKIENTKIIAEHEYKFNYEFNRNYLTIPNEIDGEIVMESRTDETMKDVLFDKIKSIEEVPNTTNYAYDLTVVDTRNFNIYNGLTVRDTFHFSGVSSKSNVTRGVPRIEEILSLSSEPKNPSLTVHLKPGDETDKDKAHTIMYMLEHTRLEEIVQSVEICFDPDDLNTLINDDKTTIEQYRAFENMIDECANAGSMEETNEKSKWVIRMVMDPVTMLEKNITMDDVHFALKNSYTDEVSCIYSDYNADKLVFRIRMNNVVKQSAARASAQKKTKVNPLDQSDQIYILKNFQDELLNNIVLRGIKGINKVSMRKIKDNVVEQGGVFKKQDIWVLDTIGTNMLDVLGLDYVDAKRVFSNNIVEVYETLGIEAARQTIYNELVDVIEFDGTYINYHHFCVLCDRMTFTSKMISIFRHGINNDNIGPIAKASFEETPEMFLKAARHAELDTMRGISANVMCGQEGFFGTSAFQVVLDMETMKTLEEEKRYEEKTKDEEEEEIEKMFQVEAKEDACGTTKMAIQNNVVSIKPKDMGKDNTYEPGF
jgi:DNA-directed RNA polymerase beta' subunit